MSQYFIKRGEKVQGPLSLKSLKRLADTGQLRESDLVARSKSGVFTEITHYFKLSQNQGEASSKSKTNSSRSDPAVSNQNDVTANQVPTSVGHKATDPLRPKTVPNKSASTPPQAYVDTHQAKASAHSPQVPFAADEPQSVNPLPVPSSTKQCPFCAETIAFAAIKCKHCGEFLNSRATQSSSPPEGKPLELTQESEFAFLVRGPYPLVYALAKQSLENCEGTLKKEELASGLVEGGWRYGLNPFLRVRWTLEDTGNGCVRSNAYGYYSDGTMNRSKAIEKAKLVVKTFQELSPTAHESIAVPHGVSASNAPPSSAKSTKEGGGGLALASLICAFLSVFCFGCIFGPMAILLGIASIMTGCPDTQIARAWTGIIVGIAGLVLHAILMLFYMTMF